MTLYHLYFSNNFSIITHIFDKKFDEEINNIIKIYNKTYKLKLYLLYIVKI